MATMHTQTSKSLDLARSVYELLIHKHPDGLTRLDLASKLKCDDRAARDAVNACRTLAATNPMRDGRVWIIGFDPLHKVYCAARDPYVARRIIEYQSSRLVDINRALEAQRAAFERTFGVPYRAVEEIGLF